MSSLKFLLPVCAFVLLYISCDREAIPPALDVQGESGYTYSESKSKWLQMKKEKGDSYNYKVQEISWTGHGNNTLITIVNGKAVARTYQEFFMDPDTGSIENGYGYSETKVDLGKNEAGARPWTIDHLYSICLAEYLVVDDESNTIFFDTDEEGILTSCGFVPDDCADDCFTGITLVQFNWL